ncbi:MAG TPA: AMP-binding protein [Bryobacteraceae bacterium]|nr:AMP-binding protein [Bryobacteraceae bacterium]
MGRQNLLEFFVDYFESDAEYLVYDDGYRWWSYSYRQIANGARLFAGRLRESGIGKGDRILLWSESRPEWLYAFWGALWAGAVVVPLGSESSFEFVRTVQSIVRPKVIALGADVAWDADAAGSADAPVWRLAVEDWAKLPSQTPLPAAGLGDLVEIVFTSGSTGDPKGVEITHGNLLSQLEAVEPLLGSYRKSAGRVLSVRFLQLLPFSHMFGQVTTIGLPPLLSGSIVITRRQSPAALVKAIRARRISVAICVPRILEALRNYVTAAVPEAAGAATDRGSLVASLWRYRRVHRMFGWRLVGILPGGAPLDPALENFWRRLGFAVVQGYGLTETSPVVTLNNPLRPRASSVGKPLAGVEVRIAGDGEILVRGPNVMAGYFGHPDKTAEVLRNGWLYTGDLGRLDGDGYLYIKGRKKELIVTAEGLNVVPEDVEAVLERLPGVREAAVIGIPAEGTGEQVHAVVVLEPGGDAGQIVAQANRRLEAHQRIRGTSVWPEESLPRTPQTGKLRRAAIRDRILAGLAGSRSERVVPSARECKPELIAEEIESRIGRHVSPETRLDELGLGSIDRVELLLEIERHCRQDIDEGEFAASETVGQLENLLARALTGEESSAAGAGPFPAWNRNPVSRMVRRANLGLWILPLTRLLAKPAVSGVERLYSLSPPVIFAANHQSHLDTPLILAALPERWRYRIAPAMYKEYFAAYFHPRRQPFGQTAAATLEYYTVALLFNAFPIPQEEAGVLDALRYAGDLVSEGWSLLIFPEGERRVESHVGEFRPGVGFLATRLQVPVVPIHLAGVDRVLPRGKFIPHLGRTQITFGQPVFPGSEEPEALAHQLEEAVQAL